MPGFFEALENFKPTPPKKHYVTIEGNKIEVSLQQCLEIQQVGVENYEYKNKEIVRKVIVPKEQQQTILVKADKGYNFYDNDPYYPKDIVEEGFVWQIDTE